MSGIICKNISSSTIQLLELIQQETVAENVLDFCQDELHTFNDNQSWKYAVIMVHNLLY